MISKIRRLGLKTKWLIYALIFILFFSTTLVSFFLNTGKKGLEKELKKWGSSLAKNLADNARETVASRDYASLTTYLYGVMNHSEIIYSVIMDSNGSILAIEDPNSMVTSKILNTPFTQAYSEINVFHDEAGLAYYNLIEPIIRASNHRATAANGKHFDPMERVISELNRSPDRAPEKLLGTVILGISQQNMILKLKRMRDRAIYIAMVSTFIVIAFVFWGVERITRPIKDLVNATQKVARGDLSHVVPDTRLDEIGILARSFNEMIVKLKESQQEVEHYTHTLEQKVEERTHELQLSEHKYRILFEHAGTAIALIDKTGKFLMINKVFEILSGYSKDQLEERAMLSQFLSNNDCKGIKNLCNGNKNGTVQFPVNKECSFIDQKGNYRNVNLTISLIPETSNLLVSIVDVTELRELQKKLIRSQQLAALGELSAAIAHEIRNPLVAINTSVGILRNGLDLEDEDEELMNIISEEAMRLNKIVDDFLKFARPNEPQFLRTDINGLIRETILILRNRFNGIDTKIQLTEDLPIISGDPDQLKQVLMNILINAIESMPSGGTLSIATRYGNNSNGHLQTEIVIKDTGNGIQDTDLSKIFQPFFSTKKDGVGMGLAICERIIQNHDGEIKVNSRFGMGTEFIISLPIKTS